PFPPSPPTITLLPYTTLFRSKIRDSASPFAAATADLPHHMTWFDGERLYLFTPTALRVTQVIEQAIGTGVSAGDKALVPTSEGIDRKSTRLNSSHVSISYAVF